MANDVVNPIDWQNTVDSLLNNGVPVNSITPDAHNGALVDGVKTASFFTAQKFNIIADGEPGTGQISLIAKNFNTADSIRINKTNAHLKNVSQLLASLAGGGVVHLKTYEGAIFGEFALTGVADNGGYITISVTANSSNPTFAPGSPTEATVSFYAKSDSVNIMNTDLVMAGKRIQDMNGDIMSFQNGFLKLGDDFKIYIDDLRDLGTTGTDLDVNLEGGADAMEVVVDNNFTLEFSDLLIGSGFINMNIGAPGNFVMTTGASVEWKDGIAKDLTVTSGAKDRLYWTCDGAKVEVSLSPNLG